MSFLFSKQPSTPEKNMQSILLFVGVVLIASFGLRLWQWMNPPTQPPLLSQDSTLVEVASVADIPTWTDTHVIQPIDTFGSELKAIGIYPEDNPLFPKGTVALLYVRNGFRFVEVSERPHTTIEKEMAIFGLKKTDTIALKKDVSGKLVHLRPFAACKQSDPSLIGICQMTNVFIFQKDDLVIVISTDGDHASKEEIVNMARGILQ